MSFARLFSPGRLGPLFAQNRVAMPAVHLGLAAGGPGEALFAFYERRARGGAGLLTVGVCNTWDGPTRGLAGAVDLSRDGCVAPMAELAGRVHVHGALVGAQLAPLADYNNPGWKMGAGDVLRIVEGLAAAAARVKAAGLDFVELMLSGGSLLSYFLSPAYNTFAIPGYSNGWEERLRAAREAVRAIRAACGPGFPVLARIHGHEFLEGGYGSDDAAIVARALVEEGIAAINVTGGGHRTRLPQITMQVPPAGLAYLARVVRSSVPVPILAGGRVRVPREAEALLSSGNADFVNAARALLVDPDWPRKAASGDAGAIVPCMACGACFDAAISGKPVRCSLNPEAGLSEELSGPGRSAAPGRAIVVGSGPAGLTAAWELGRRGHCVTVLEKDARAGGAWNLAAMVHDRTDLASARDAFVARLGKAGVSLEAGRDATPGSVKALGAEILVLAAGSRRRTPDILGLDTHPCVLDAATAVREQDRVGRRVAIVGAGGTGLELAIHLASLGEPRPDTLGFLARYGNRAWLDEALRVRSDREITLLRRRGFVGKGLGRSVRWTLMLDLERLGVRVIDRCSYESASSEGLAIIDERSGAREIIACDTIVLACGSDPRPDLVATFEGCAPRVVAVGDVASIGSIGDAVRSAYEAVKDL
ncbi:MAG: FAD-dependent oxidoreductase [Deltaproteobacteria bacterium]|nr:FAD-dependent oxidoreductase [Deltaproteobacteria bacterium]